MKICSVLLLALLACVGWQNIPKSDAPKPNLTTPEKTLQSFVAAVSKKETLAAASCVEGAESSANLLELQKIENLTFHVVQKMVFGFSDLHIETKDDMATALLVPTIEIQVDGKTVDKMPPIPAEHLTLRRKGSEWKIVPEDLETIKIWITKPEQAKGSVIAGYAAGYVHPEIFVPARYAALRVGCRKRMRQACAIASFYILDHDDKFAFKATDYKKALLPTYLKLQQDSMKDAKESKPYIEAETKREFAFHCPLDAKDSTGFAFNANLQKLSLSAIKDPAHTVMLYEGANGKLDFRHEGKATIGFVDSHVAELDAQAAKKLLWLPYPTFKPGKP